MKMIVAVIRPEKVDDVVDALEAVNVPGVTITDVRGRGEQGGICLQYRAGKMQIHTLPKTKLEIVVPDKDVETIIKTGRKGTAVSLCCLLRQLHGCGPMTSSPDNTVSSMRELSPISIF